MQGSSGRLVGVDPKQHPYVYGAYGQLIYNNGWFTIAFENLFHIANGFTDDFNGCSLIVFISNTYNKLITQKAIHGIIEHGVFEDDGVGKKDVLAIRGFN